MSSRALTSGASNRPTNEIVDQRGPLHQQSPSQSITTLASPLRLQTKLTINTPGDQYEQEADRVAEQVMRMPEPSVQRQCSCGKSSGGECDECKKKKKVTTGSIQRTPTSTDSEIIAPQIVDRVLSSPGSPLPESTRSFMEARFHQDFSHVRVHTNSEAIQSADAVQARAFTVGSNIVFGRGEYPSGDRRLLAHELTHVLQQGSAESSNVEKRHIQREKRDIARPTGVSQVVVSCVDKKILFKTSSGDLIYSLTECELDEGVYAATVSVQGKEVKFGLANTQRGVRFRFSYSFRPGQIDPVALFGTQSSVEVVATNLLASRKEGENSNHEQGKKTTQNPNELEQFKKLVISVAKLRLNNNKRNLYLWKSFIKDRLSPDEAGGLIMAEKTRQLEADAASRKSHSHLDRFYTAQSPVEREYARNLVTGDQCPSCHAEQRVWENKRRASPGESASPNWIPIENRMRNFANASKEDPNQTPNIVSPSTNTPMDGIQSPYPSINSVRESRSAIGSYLEVLGPNGYRIIDSKNWNGPPEQLRERVLRAIDQRQSDYDAFISKISAADFDYLELRPIVRDLLLVASDNVRYQVGKEIEAAKDWETVQAVVVGLATVGALVLTVFPPTTAVGAAGLLVLEGGLAAYGIKSGIESVEKGNLYAMGAGANNVLDPEQQDAANVLRAMGYLNLGLSGIGVLSTSLRGVRLVRSAVKPNGMSVLKTIEGEANGVKVRVTDLDTAQPKVQVLDNSGRVLKNEAVEEAAQTASRAKPVDNQVGQAAGRTAGSRQRSPTGDAYPASLSERLAAYKQWKGNAGISGKPTQAEFRRFVGAHRPNSRGSTLYFEDGGFAAWSQRVSSTHGNTAGSQTAWLYRLENDSGEFLKWGISEDPFTRYSGPFMRDKVIIPIRSGPRNVILEVERDLTERMPGPLNFEPWAGSRLGQ